MKAITAKTKKIATGGRAGEMTFRDHVATCALEAVLQTYGTASPTASQLAVDAAYRIADQMIATREGTSAEPLVSDDELITLSDRYDRHGPNDLVARLVRDLMRARGMAR